MSAGTPLLRWRLWLPGLGLSVGGAIFGLVLMPHGGRWGWLTWIALPWAAGAILGCRTRTRWFFLPVLVVLSTLMMSAGGILLNLMSLLTGTVLAGLFLVPVAMGTAAGFLLRLYLDQAGLARQTYVAAIILLGLPVVGGVLGGGGPGAPETVRTSQITEAPLPTVWKHLVAWVPSDATPPLLLRLGRLHPVGLRGRATDTGSVVTAVYRRGYLTAEVTDMVEPEGLAFAITEQVNAFVHELRLVGGGCTLVPAGPGVTRIALETTYQPLFSPRWCWAPFEQLAIHTLHRHVLASIAPAAEQEAGATAPAEGQAARPSLDDQNRFERFARDVGNHAVLGGIADRDQQIGALVVRAPEQASQKAHRARRVGERRQSGVVRRRQQESHRDADRLVDVVHLVRW
jgi:hypothetical protein